MNRMMRTTVFATLAGIFIGGGLYGQTPSDPALQKAREETVVVQDLGRMFGYLNGMEKDAKVPALSADQLKRLYDIMTELQRTKRVEPRKARDFLTEIEDEILTPAQLMAADKLAAAKMAERTTVPGSGAGAGAGGSSSLTSYVAGGDYNPIVDTSKPMGQDFHAFYQYAAKKLGR